MAIRIRKTGELLCAAKCEEMDDDRYIDDGLHYELSAIQKVLVADKDEAINGRWYWLHGWCETSEHPTDVRTSPLTKVEKPPRKLKNDQPH